MITVTKTTRGLCGQEMVTPRWRTITAGVVTVGVALGWVMAVIVPSVLSKINPRYRYAI
jgi:hypothetical protein